MLYGKGLSPEALGARSAADAERSRARQRGVHRSTDQQGVGDGGCLTFLFYEHLSFRVLVERCSQRTVTRIGPPVSPHSKELAMIAMHQLLSGQLGVNPTPNVSFLYDCGDQGIRPI